MVQVLEWHLLHFLSAFFAASKTDGCGTVNKRTPLERLQALIQRAEEQIDGGLIVLPFFQSSLIAPDSSRIINRTPVGSTANFSCTAERPSGLYMVAAEHQAIVWRHLNRSIYSNAKVPPTSEPFAYSQAAAGHIYYLFIHNVSVSAAGHVDCLQSWNGTDPENLYMREQYNLRPKLRTSDLFIGQMQNKSVRYRGEFDFTCHLRHTECAYSGTGPYFIWKVNEIFAIVPKDHYLFPLAHSQNNPYAMIQTQVSSQHYEPVSCSTTLNIKVLTDTDHPPVRVQCWVRPNPGTEEWYVQTAYATIYQMP